MGYNNAKNEMKSIEKIQKAIEQLNNIVSWTKDDPDTSVAAEMAAKLLREVIADNTQVKKTELSVKEFVGKDSNLRPLMCCIYHDPEEHVAVATDAHAVFVNAAEYIVRAGVDGWECNAEKDLENGNRGIIKRWDGKQLLLMPMLMLDSHDNRLTTDEEEARGWQAAEE